MRVALNLATRPYLELGPLYRRLRIAMVALAILAVPLWLLLRSETRKAAAAHAQFTEVQQSIQHLESQREAFQVSMRQPRNAEVLDRSHFLNSVFARKAFSWTAVMMDLEKVLPAGVQVLSIDPVITKDGHVTIRMRVAGERERAVELVRNLEHSHRFLYPKLAGETAENTSQNTAFARTSGGVNFDILADYNPLPLADGGKTAEKDTQKTAKQGGGR